MLCVCARWRDCSQLAGARLCFLQQCTNPTTAIPDTTLWMELNHCLIWYGVRTRMIPWMNGLVCTSIQSTFQHYCIQWHRSYSIQFWSCIPRTDWTIFSWTSISSTQNSICNPVKATRSGQTQHLLLLKLNCRGPVWEEKGFFGYLHVSYAQPQGKLDQRQPPQHYTILIQQLPCGSSLRWYSNRLLVFWSAT